MRRHLLIIQNLFRFLHKLFQLIFIEVNMISNNNLGIILNELGRKEEAIIDYI